MNSRRIPFSPLAILMSILFVYTMVRFSLPTLKSGGRLPVDFSACMLAVSRFMSGQEVFRPEEASPFKYSPAYIVFLKNFIYSWKSNQSGLVPSWFVFCALSAGTWILCLHQLLKHAMQNATRSGRKYFALIMAVGFISHWHGYLEHLSYGQADFLVATLIFFATYACMKKRDQQARLSWMIASIIAIAAALQIKPTALIFLSSLAYFEPVLVIIAGIVTPLLLLMSILPQGLTRTSELISHWIVSLGQQPAELFSGNLNQNLGASLARVMGHPEWAIYFCKGSLAIGIGIFLVCFAKGAAKKIRVQKNSASLSKDSYYFGYCLSAGLYLCLTPLSWRWMTFIWWPMFAIAGTRNMSKTPILLVAFAMTAFLLQTIVANTIGISEVDTLSYWGGYSLGSVLLTASLFLSKSPAK